MRRIVILISVAIAASMGSSSAKAESDRSVEPPVELWRQQTSRPALSVTLPDVAGRLRKFTYVNIDGHAITEGDISVGTVADVEKGKVHLPGVLSHAVKSPPFPKPSRVPTERMTDNCTRTPTVAGVNNPSVLWPGGQVPYSYDPSLPKAVRDTVTKAIADFSAATCVRFVPQTSETAFVRIFSGSGCYSMLGRTGTRQDLSLGPGCNYKGTVVHELMHAIGFHHEHNRSDRDETVTVRLENVSSTYQSQFQKVGTAQNRLFGGFDPKSVMIYGNKAFSSNGQDTLVAKNGQALTDPYAKPGFSPADIAGVRGLYGC